MKGISSVDEIVSCGQSCRYTGIFYSRVSLLNFVLCLSVAEHGFILVGQYGRRDASKILQKIESYTVAILSL